MTLSTVGADLAAMAAWILQDVANLSLSLVLVLSFAHSVAAGASLINRKRR